MYQKISHFEGFVWNAQKHVKRMWKVWKVTSTMALDTMRDSRGLSLTSQCLSCTSLEILQVDYYFFIFQIINNRGLIIDYYPYPYLPNYRQERMKFKIILLHLSRDSSNWLLSLFQIINRRGLIIDYCPYPYLSNYQQERMEFRIILLPSPVDEIRQSYQ